MFRLLRFASGLILVLVLCFELVWVYLFGLLCCRCCCLLWTDLVFVLLVVFDCGLFVFDVIAVI